LDLQIKRHFIPNLQSKKGSKYYKRAKHLYVELILVVDHKIYKAFDSDLDKVHHYCKDVANVVDIVSTFYKKLLVPTHSCIVLYFQIYEPLNISIVLSGVIVWNEWNVIHISKRSASTLINFLNYRRDVLNKMHRNDNAQLLTMQKFEKGVVGKSRINGICSLEHSGGVNAAFNHTVFGFMGAVVAHEIAHNLGIQHDEDDCICQAEDCIMSKIGISTKVPLNWSSCSIEHVKMATNNGMYHCLR
jgi:hypothetical protein